MKNQKKSKCLCIGITLLIVLEITYLYVWNHFYWYQIDSMLSGAAVRKLIVGFLNTVIISLIGIEFTDFLERKHKQVVCLFCLPITLLLVRTLMTIWGVVADGRMFWLQLSSYATHYCVILLFVLCLTIPKGLDWLLNRNYRREEFLVPGYILLNMLLCIVFFGGLQGAFLCGAFILLCYLFKTKNKKKWFSILTFIFGMVVAYAYEVIRYSDVRELIDSFKQNVLYEIPTAQITSFMEAGVYDTKMIGFSYYYPLTSMRMHASVWGIILLAILYLLLIGLLIAYIMKFIRNDTNRKAAFFLLTFMFIYGIVSMLSEFIGWRLLFFIQPPFSTRETYVWLEVLLIVFSLSRELPSEEEQQ